MYSRTVWLPKYIQRQAGIVDEFRSLERSSPGVHQLGSIAGDAKSLIQTKIGAALFGPAAKGTLSDEFTFALVPAARLTLSDGSVETVAHIAPIVTDELRQTLQSGGEPSLLQSKKSNGELDEESVAMQPLFPIDSVSVSCNIRCPIEERPHLMRKALEMLDDEIQKAQTHLEASAKELQSLLCSRDNFPVDVLRREGQNLSDLDNNVKNLFRSAMIHPPLDKDQFNQMLIRGTSQNFRPELYLVFVQKTPAGPLLNYFSISPGFASRK